LSVVVAGYRTEDVRPVENPVTVGIDRRIPDSECLVRCASCGCGLAWPARRRRGEIMKIRLGVDIACRAPHQASAADEHGEMLFAGHRFRTDPDELETLWARLPEADEAMVIMEPTRNAWVALASWFRRRGATVVMVPDRAVR
jgi:hypothetical protein